MSLHSHSYTFVDRSLHNGRLENLDDHIAGPPAGTIRTVGSSVQPAKGTRRPFSPEDDQVLFKWVVDSERKGGKIYGIKIYQELEKQVFLQEYPLYRKCTHVSEELKTYYSSMEEPVGRPS